MNILILSGFWPTNHNTISGIFVVQQVAAFARLGWTVTVVVEKTLGRPSAPYLSVEDLGLDFKRVRLVEISVLRFPEKFSIFYGAFFLNVTLARLIYKFTLLSIIRSFGNFEGCIVHGIRNNGFSLPAWRSLLSGNAVIVLHGVDPFFEKLGNLCRARNFFAESANFADAVILVGKSLKTHAISLGVPLHKICVVSNGTDLPHRDSVSNAQHFPPEVRRIVSVSNLVALKGIDLNLCALAALYRRRPDLSWTYHVVGDGQERDRLVGITQSLGISEKVRFLGRLSYEATMREVAEADIFSLPSWGEAFGIVYLEAMARMRPVIGCFENGAADIITHEVEGLLVPPRDVSGLEVAFETLIESPELCKQLGSNGRKRAEEFSWEHNVQCVLSVLGIESESECG